MKVKSQMPSHMIGFIPPEIGVPWHLGSHSSHHAATQTNKTMLSNFKFLCQSHMLHWIPNSDAEELIKFQRIMVYQADMRGECCAFQASDNNAEVKAIVNSKHDTFENTELRGDPSITHRRITEVSWSWIPSIKNLRIHQQSKCKRWSKSLRHFATLTPKLIQKTTTQQTEEYNLCYYPSFIASTKYTMADTNQEMHFVNPQLKTRLV